MLLPVAVDNDVDVFALSFLVKQAASQGREVAAIIQLAPQDAA